MLSEASGDGNRRQAEVLLLPSPTPVGLLPAGIEYEDQSHADTLSSSAESNQMQPDRSAIQFSQDETLEVTSKMFDYLLRQAVQEFEQKVNKEETR
jgi:hypothetical protein